jgi:hypothetical protein
MDNPKIIYAKAFNNHLLEFFDDLILIFPNEKDISIGKKSCQTIINMNITSILKIWYRYSYQYHEQIENGDISFFMEKDYSSDIENAYTKSEAEDVIKRLRDPIRLLDNANKEKAMKYIQNLTKISKVFIE